MLHPVNVVNGLEIMKGQENIPFKYQHKNHYDKVLVKAAVGELVIPRRYVLPVENYLKSKNIHLSGMK